MIRLLTAREAFLAFPGLYYQRLYHMVETGHVEALHRNDGRTYYSEAQLAAALRAAIAAALEYGHLVETAA